LEQPAEIDADKVTASLEKGILQITALKATVKSSGSGVTR
jgi:HSP20 family molecular chaperone IbpA